MGTEGIEKLLKMQEELMEKVPHGIRVDIYPKMVTSKCLIESIILYLNSCGHKPWRPHPLAPSARDEALLLVVEGCANLRLHHSEDLSTVMTEARELVSAFGIIEEVIEYLNASPNDRKSKLEEITDILFFYLESVLLGGFTWPEVEEEYVRKHAVNLERYRRAKEGDYGWDRREEGAL